MRAEALNPIAWSVPDEHEIAGREHAPPDSSVPISIGWNKQTFAAEQIRGLVRQVFSAPQRSVVHHVVVCPVENETKIRSLCLWMGEVLAHEKKAEVAVIDESEIRSASDDVSHDGGGPRLSRPSPVRQSGMRLQQNLWSFGGRGALRWASAQGGLADFMAEVRREFEYSIVAAPTPTVSSKVLDMATSADGLILVLSAQRTRRVAALKVRSALAQVRLLGTVLTDREFPIPTGIYRRL